ncbi:MAG: D-alanyl-D-alanine carboxypeptidase/D-alanyl-D-alanine-endopeptidase [Shewanella sp. CG18_big_fil_WC_8_21_14_2_50_42_11]|nr:MAG: D-alanyl-D-alanine carboxypeptidase/D-alanyl-D-alanine-endopeptidase [Shewanella sp. CG18_big_fil_WC_8_21_14_2_50_42_11]PIX72110.1 MAG: D-alanyl-D-alanine carboxypeptidase/D-alanyl-D-alanine-endopeptidase [Shewanella sp. CG_4_10_14_3_um_filter_42_91]PIY65474.1 MAG: D-alanyl-D-alanine carboxypeptidase/D-alanyl-D-alanine-endopeptidase [Shewanella sp. CG_4_10_14_0_8_um_filter_42_13]PJB92471.1 MAG: D-alanyl-D-alanine carboxypeptidase/D-alanyl-D-alanine-endopeptidase [Shewanella sp. CG_4_9_14
MTSILFHLPRPHSSHRQQPLWLRRSLFLLGSLMIICLPNTVSAVEPLTQPAVVQPQIPSSPLENINQQPTALYLDNMLQLLKPIHSQLGITVWDMTSQKTVFQYNNQSLMQPASVQKLLTALAATKQLGKQFSYQTQLTTLADQPLDKTQINNGIYSGDIYIEFSGDPTLTFQDLHQLLGSLSTLGITKLTGNIMLASEQDSQLQAPGWVWDDLGICYAAPISPFIINKNCVYGRLSTNGYNKVAKITMMGNRPIDITNDAYFVSPTIDNPVVKPAVTLPVTNALPAYLTESVPQCQLTLSRFDNNRYHLSGCHVGAKSLPLAIAISDPQIYAQHIIAKQLESLGIRYNHPITTIKMNKQPKFMAQRQVIASHQSDALPQLLETMLLESDNLIADSLLKKLGEVYYQTPSDFARSGQALKTILYSIGIDLSTANIADGSGLSRYNLLTPEHVLSVLTVIYQQPEYRFLLDLLPESGVSGTLRYKRYFNKSPLKHHVFAKTGSMLGIANLAGRVNVSNGHNYLFVLFENGLSPQIKKQQKAPFSAVFLQTMMDVPR